MQTYDYKSGLVYTEATIDVTSMLDTWMSNSSGVLEDPSKCRNASGPPSLRDAALRACAWNIHNPGMTETLIDYYEHDGASIVDQIYQHIKERDAISCKVWAIFKTVCPEKVPHRFDVRVPNKVGTSKIPTISRQLNELPFEMLTFLCIQNVPIGPVSLNTDLLKFQNLSVLILQQHRNDDYGRRGNKKDDDRMIRKWGLSVHSANAFTKLKVLVLKRFDISVEALGGPTVFPSLLLCNLDSWFIKKDLENSIYENKPFVYNRWRQMLTDSNAQNAPNSDPEITWKRTDINTSRKMEILHELATKNPASKFSTADQLPVISVNYGDATAKSRYLNSYSAWFTRIPCSETEENEREELTKRPAEPVPRGGSAAKKPKMRSGKQTDIGSMLGNFGT
ncbi:hypothetical protein B0J11DRAFT_513632 [Dendryphion nanum]|uniref:Uncharacterized protein n=1 Tax=Dendryphion nanum TaxID=256645 RepID=A0A9P9EHW1_9PLEO|nr:hypothetical protein B0J11DRAFT_513632 [Dendryphion nanum]